MENAKRCVGRDRDATIDKALALLQLVIGKTAIDLAQKRALGIVHGVAHSAAEDSKRLYRTDAPIQFGIVAPFRPPQLAASPYFADYIA